MQLLLKSSRWSGPHAVFDGLAGSLTTPEKPVENVPLHKRPPQLLQGQCVPAYMQRAGTILLFLAAVERI